MCYVSFFSYDLYAHVIAGKFDVTSVHDFKWNKTAFKNLVLDTTSETSLLLAHIEAKTDPHSASFDNFIDRTGTIHP